MLHLHSVSKSYGKNPLFSQVSFTVGAKEKIGIMGRNGYGKSTLFKLITGEELPDDGRIEIPETYTIRALEQHLNFEHSTLLQQVTSSLPLHEQKEDWKAKSILMGLGFPQDDFLKHPTKFSSGFQVRIRLAQALVSSCDLLMLDEPTNYLDIVSLRWLQSFLQEWNSSFLLITHNLGFMQSVISHSAIIHRGKMRKMKGPPQKLLQQIEKDESVYEKTRQMEEKKKAKTEHFIKNFRAGARSAGLVQSRIKMLEKQEPKEKLAKLPQVHFTFPALPFTGDHLLRAWNISFGYQNPLEESVNHLLIEKLQLEITKGDRIGIIGQNGKGKTTLLKILADYIAPTSGHLKRYHTLTRGYFGQEEESHEWKEETILSELLSLPKVTETEARSVAASLLFTGNEVKKPIRMLSGGEKARVRLGKLMLKQHHLLLLDEPSNHLDIESVEKLMHALQKFEGAMVLVSHDERILSSLVNKLVVFNNNTVTVFHGGYQDFLETEGWGENQSIHTSVKKDEEMNPKKTHHKDRKAMQKKLRTIIAQQGKKEKENTQCDAEIEKLSFALHKAIKKSDSVEVAKLGKKIKECEEKKEKNREEIEDLLMQQIELEEILE